MKTLPNKFVIKIHSREHSKVVQERLFELGCKWQDGRRSFIDYAWSNYKAETVFYVGINVVKLEITYGEFKNYEKKYSHVPLISTDDLFSAEKEIIVKVKLNSEYEATVSKAGIVVGCQTFPLDIVEKLMAAKNKLMDIE